MEAQTAYILEVLNTMNDWILAMTDQNYRKELGKRIKALRKKQRMTQREFAGIVGITFGQLNKYESGLNNPAPDILVKMAKSLDTSLDTLMTGYQPGDIPLSNSRLIERLKELESIDPEDQETAIKLLDAIIIKNRAAGLLSPIDKQTA